MNTGGSYNLGIDYDGLPFPGPEVGRMAVEITAQIKSERKRSANDNDNNNNDSINNDNNNNGSINNNNNDNDDIVAPSHSPSRPDLELVTLAGGCFWGLQLALQRLEGVEHTLVGYTQGLDTELRPNYEQVSAGNTGHCEAVVLYMDASRVSFETVLRKVFFERVDLTTIEGQGKDFGKHYRTGIYFHTAEQEETARRLMAEELATNPRYNNGNSDNGDGDSNNNNNNNNRIIATAATELKPARAFWPAEEYHQKYLEKGGRFGRPQSAVKGSTNEIRCYG